MCHFVFVYPMFVLLYRRLSSQLETYFVLDKEEEKKPANVVLF
jgi:hypothetical protein